MKNDTAVLVVSFGTTHLDTLKRNILATENAIAGSFREHPIYRAFLSPMVIRRLKEKHGMKVDTVAEALARISGDGCRRVVVQPTLITEGLEYKLLRKELTAEKNLRISVGRPLLMEQEDCEALASIIIEENPLREKETLVLMGHGTAQETNAVYHMMQEIFDHTNYHCLVGTVKGTPSFQDVAEQLTRDETQEAKLLPLMFVAGNHAKNDMAGEEDSLLSLILEKGVKAVPIFRGLGESRKVQELYAAHAKEAFCRM